VLSLIAGFNWYGPNIALDHMKLTVSLGQILLTMWPIATYLVVANSIHDAQTTETISKIICVRQPKQGGSTRTLDRLFTESSSLADFAGRYTDYIAELLNCLDWDAIDRIGRILENARHLGRTIFLIGNGGSAATASHFANDLSIGPRKLGAQAYRAISLSDNTAVLTAAGNDLGYDTVFVEQARSRHNRLYGFDGGALGSMVSEHVNVATPKGDYGPVEDLHLMLNHLISSYLVRLTCENNRSELPYLKKRPAIVRAPAVLRADTA
jgi:D-sedoheptulose 7-phosphate isomerase